MFDLELDNEKYLCKALHNYENTVERLNFFDSIFTLVIPFLGLLIMNIMNSSIVL